MPKFVLWYHSESHGRIRYLWSATKTERGDKPVFTYEEAEAVRFTHQDMAAFVAYVSNTLHGYPLGIRAVVDAPPEES
jgi:hypothetical protein